MQQLSSNNFPLGINSLLGDQVSNVAKVALFVLYEQQLGEVKLFTCFSFSQVPSSTCSSVWRTLIDYFVSPHCLQQSEWAPYISRLPQPAEMHSTVDDYIYIVIKVNFVSTC